MQDELRQSRPFADPEVELYLSLLRTADVLAWHSGLLLKQAGLSHAQYNVLRILRGAGEEGLGCGEISARMITRDPDVTRLLDRLVKRGLIARARQAGDRRVVSARILPAGLDLLATLDAPVVQSHREQFGDLAPEEMRRMIDLLEKVRETLGRPARRAPQSARTSVVPG